MLLTDFTVDMSHHIYPHRKFSSMSVISIFPAHCPSKKTCTSAHADIAQKVGSTAVTFSSWPSSPPGFLLAPLALPVWGFLLPAPCTPVPAPTTAPLPVPAASFLPCLARLLRIGAGVLVPGALTRLGFLCGNFCW